MVLCCAAIWKIAIATIVGMAIGWAWYSPWFFVGPLWMRISGQTDFTCSGSEVFGSFLISILVATGFYFLLYVAGVPCYTRGIGLAVLVWLFFGVSSNICGVFFGGRPFKLWGLESIGQLVHYIAVSGMLFYLK